MGLTIKPPVTHAYSPLIQDWEYTYRQDGTSMYLERRLEDTALTASSGVHGLPVIIV